MADLSAFCSSFFAERRSYNQSQIRRYPGVMLQTGPPACALALSSFRIS